MAKNPFKRTEVSIVKHAAEGLGNIVNDEQRQQLADKVVDRLISLIDVAFDGLVTDITESKRRKRTVSTDSELPQSSNDLNGLVGDVLVPEDQIVNTESKDSGLANFNSQNNNDKTSEV